MRKLFGLLVMGFVYSFSNAQTFAESILQDMVNVKDGKFLMVQYLMVTPDGSDDQKQVSVYTEAPDSGVISRDFFMYMSLEFSKSMLEGIIGENYKSDDLDELIGDPDISVNILMVKSGMQIKINDQGEKKQITYRWSDFDE